MGEETEQQQLNQEDIEMAEEIKQETQQAEQSSYTWPVIRFDVSPYRTYNFYNQFRTNPSNPNNFLKGIRWSPDGSCFLISTDDNTFHAFNLLNFFYRNRLISKRYSYNASLVLKEGEAIYDYCWYPFMSASDPVTCVFASTTRDHPIHLWDAASGQLRCTYRAFDAMDEITAAMSIGFNPAGTKIFAGYNKTIRIFDIHRPGRDCEQHSTHHKNKEGQSGIISAIAFSPTHTGMLATGSYNQTTAIYREDNMESLYVLHGQEGGVTHVQFSNDGNYLYTGGRKDPYIICWDIRNTVNILYKLYRSTETTNQRIQFDIEPSGRHLGTGGQDGLVHIYDLQTGQWVSSFQAASDTVSGFSFHPYLPMAASSSGHRRFWEHDDDEDNSNLSGICEENCASVWSFSYYSAEDYDASTNSGDINEKPENELNGQPENESFP
ncbi:hypothetical protein DCAR_0209114 [Daucus carota subsp. sativus]|uniref:Anaphase-promoting complex subunit 4 WD40 domain-containing protein n=1 Tax=Daucus carota subsp. sativus TaxID=79200 RepID=A0AAF0WKN8_DAUCS|nr:hypothetical protein DCAR_0209114 [Daucus carota subsp. sativus]